MTTEEQKQAVNAASARVLESCHCMHCNELLITPSVWDTSTTLATLARLFVPFVFSAYLWRNPGRARERASERAVRDSRELMSVDKATETVFHSSDRRMKQGGFRRR